MKLSRLSSYCAWLADEAPGVHANVNFHDEVAEAAGIRLGLVRRVRRNGKPVAGFNFVGLVANVLLGPVVPRGNAGLFYPVFAVADFSLRHHFARVTPATI